MDRKGPPQPQDQVFINFRGDELRNNFISHLVDALQRNEINVFTDKKEKVGNYISNLFTRIDDSKIAVAVFSKRYTESKWCLDELVRMKERADGNNLTVLPIFYNVTTADVKDLEGDFGKNFRRLMRDKDSVQSKIDSWKEALSCVSGILGLTFNDKRLPENDFIGNIVEEVKKLLKAIPSVQAANSLANKLPVRGETSPAKKTNSQKFPKAQKGNLKSPPKAGVVGYTGSNSLAPPQATAMGQGITIQLSQTASPVYTLRSAVRPVQGVSNTVVQTSHGSGFTGTRPPYNGYPIRYGNHESAGRGETSSTTSNSKKPLKPSKRNLEFTGTNGWPS